MTTEETRSPGTMRVGDWIMSALAAYGVRHAFMVPGGGAMHLNDAVGLHPDITMVSTLHEQAAAIGAETYAKASGRLAACIVTSGPGSTNAVTGIAGAWLDSTPMLVLSGQAKRADLVGESGVRQRGVQEVSIIPIVSSLTKYAHCVLDPEEIRYHLERALHAATSGRPGPVWLDLPLDVQGASIDPATLVGFDPASLESDSQLHGAALEAESADAVQRFAEASRPLVLIGAGVRLAGAEAKVLQLVETLGVPALSTWPAQGVVGDDHPLFVGRPGLLAPRGANFALQNADYLLCLGARLDLVTTGYDPKDFGRNAYKVVVEIDPAELRKLEGAIDRGVLANVGDFVDAMLPLVEGSRRDDHDSWRAQCAKWKTQYPVITDDLRSPSGFVSTYELADVLSELFADDDVIVPGSSGLGIEIFQLALRLHTGQRVVSTTALGAMGYGPPTAVGACIGANGRRTICVDGDGGLQLNVQELETIRRLGLPIKLFILSNDGYASIRASQQRWFGRVVGADPSSGLTLPPLELLAGAYGLPFVRLDPDLPLLEQVRAIIDSPGPVLCEVPAPPLEPRQPVQVSVALPDGGVRSLPLEDLAPRLEREEFDQNMAWSDGGRG
jgi:acetolactate synthase-1/2/3 large subunit